MILYVTNFRFLKCIFSNVNQANKYVYTKYVYGLRKSHIHIVSNILTIMIIIMSQIYLN